MNLAVLFALTSISANGILNVWPNKLIVQNGNWNNERDHNQGVSKSDELRSHLVACVK